MMHPEAFDSNNRIYNWLTNHFPLMIDDKYVKTIAIAWGFKEHDMWEFVPRLVKENWQYTNAIFSIRFGLPFAVFVQIRWSDDPNDKKQYQQLGAGWKQSGRFAVHFRVQSDATSETGYHAGMPNTGQAQGFDYGGK